MKIFDWFKNKFSKQEEEIVEPIEEQEEDRNIEELLEEANENIKEIEELIEEIDELLYLDLYKQIEDEFEKLNPTLSIETKIKKLEKFASNKCRWNEYLVDVYKEVFKQMFDHEFSI